MFSSQQQQNLDTCFVKEAVMTRVKDDVPQVVTAALGVLEVSEVVDEEPLGSTAR